MAASGAEVVLEKPTLCLQKSPVLTAATSSGHLRKDTDKREKGAGMGAGADGAYGRASTGGKTEERKIPACKRNKNPRELQRGSCESLIHKAQKLGSQMQSASDRLKTSKGLLHRHARELWVSLPWDAVGAK